MTNSRGGVKAGVNGVSSGNRPTMPRLRRPDDRAIKRILGPQLESAASGLVGDPPEVGVAHVVCGCEVAVLDALRTRRELQRTLLWRMESACGRTSNWQAGSAHVTCPELAETYGAGA